MCSTKNARFVSSAALVFAFFSMMSIGAAQTTQIAFDYPETPNLESTCEYVSYTKIDGHLLMLGVPTSFTNSEGISRDLMPDDPTYWTFTLDLTLTPGTSTPVSVSTGTLSIWGSNTDLDGPCVSLLEGDVKEFGASIADLDPMTTLFDLRIEVTGGALASEYGAEAGIIVSPLFNGEVGDVAFDGSFAEDFTFTGVGASDTVAIVPEPCSGSLLFGVVVTGFVVLASRRFRMRRAI